MRLSLTRMSLRTTAVALMAAIVFLAVPTQAKSQQWENPVARTGDQRLATVATDFSQAPGPPAENDSVPAPLVSQPAYDEPTQPGAYSYAPQSQSYSATAGTSSNENCWAPSGWYASIGAGATFRETVHELGNPATFLEFDEGVSLNGAIGYDFDVTRIEFELGFTNNGVDIAGAGIPGVGNFVSPADGNVSLRKYMFNAYYDFNMLDSNVRPYVGAGVGFYQSEINSLFPEFFATSLGLPTAGVNATSNLPFAYQLKAGVNFDLTQRTEMYLGYCFFHGESLDFAASPFGRFHPDGAVTHSVELGFRFKL